jgi:hypothetical protein
LVNSVEEEDVEGSGCDVTWCTGPPPDAQSQHLCEGNEGTAGQTSAEGTGDRQYNDKTVSFKISIKDGKYQDSKWWYVYTDMLRVTTTTTCPHINILMWSQLTWWLRYMLLILWYVCMCSTTQYWGLQDRLPLYANKTGLFALTFCEDDDTMMTVLSWCHQAHLYYATVVPTLAVQPMSFSAAQYSSYSWSPLLTSADHFEQNKQYAQCPRTAHFAPSFYPYKGERCLLQLNHMEEVALQKPRITRINHDYQPPHTWKQFHKNYYKITTNNTVKLCDKTRCNFHCQINRIQNSH